MSAMGIPTEMYFMVNIQSKQSGEMCLSDKITLDDRSVGQYHKD